MLYTVKLREEGRERGEWVRSRGGGSLVDEGHGRFDLEATTTRKWVRSGFDDDEGHSGFDLGSITVGGSEGCDDEEISGWV